ncbi:unnamed protein product [Rhizophagus irregularis]|nr:unnamed protein product [Rhizophagus irregularis]
MVALLRSKTSSQYPHNPPIRHNNCRLSSRWIDRFNFFSDSLKVLDYPHYQEIGFTSYPGARNCLKNLSELYCSSDTSSDFSINYLNSVIIFHY